MIRDILHLGNSALKQVSQALEPEGFNQYLQDLVDDMIDTMYHHNGIGLAAAQIGILKRIFIVELPEIHAEPMVFINPVITKKSKDLFNYEEGCLSIPKVTGYVERPRTIKLEYLNLEAEKKELVAEELFATCIQHEIDHLDGILFLERVTSKEIKPLTESLNEHFPQAKISELELGTKTY